MNRPKVLIKTAMSLDGYIDDTSDSRLLLSTPEDKAAVDELRASMDAIMVGANTVRTDNPSLDIRSPELRAKRQERGLPSGLVKVTLTNSGNLEPSLKFFSASTNDKLVYCPQSIASAVKNKLSDQAIIVSKGTNEVNLQQMLADLYERGINYLMVEGGTKLNSLLLGAGLVDQLRIAIAPLLLAQDGAPKLVKTIAGNSKIINNMQLEKLEQLGNMAVLWYQMQ